MLFNSLTFIIFFSIVLILNYLLPNKYRWVMLLAASLVFYMWWKVQLIILVLLITIVNYRLSLVIHKGYKKKLMLGLCMAINFTLLFVFKYLVLAVNTIFYIKGEAAPEFDIILPMGISFYTFQAAGYTFDVYRKKLKPVKNYYKFLLFILFFPQLVAGPIERAKNLLPQLFSPKKFNLEQVTLGFKIAMFGYFKKMVIADRAAFFVNGIFNSLEYYGFLAYTIAVFLFAFQIYCDFSGYSDIAIGASKMLGVDLMKNFNRPYLSHSLKDFWRRWHISLSTWFKDYLYFPMGGSRVSAVRGYFNVLITFIVSGLWHGANWTFVVWGLLHGFLQIFEDIKTRIYKKDFKDKNPVHKVVSVIITFLLSAYLFAVFRANSIEDIAYFFTHYFWGFRESLTPQGFYTAVTGLPASLFELIVVLIAIGFLFLVELFEKKESIHELLNRKSAVLRYGFYYCVLTSIFALGVFSGGETFIYFQF